MSIDQRLAELGITLPKPAAPVASYVPAVEQGGVLHISGQISFGEDGNLILGRLGEDMVSNLMVVLCGERDTQPVVNTGTLYT